MVMVLCLWAGQPALSEEQFGNRPSTPSLPDSRLYLAPGAVLRLPDGRETRILRQLPDGTFQTDVDVIVSPEGSIPETGYPVTVIESPKAPHGVGTPNMLPETQRQKLNLAPGTLLRLPDGRQTRILRQLPDGTFQTDIGVLVSPDGRIPGTERPVTVLESPQVTPAVPQTRPTKPQPETARTPNALRRDVPVTPPTVVVPERTLEQPAHRPPVVQGPLTLAELLPTTPIPQSRPQASAPDPARKPQPEKPRATTRPEQQKTPPVPPKKDEAKPKKAEKPKPAEKPQPEPKPHRKPKVGEALRIPPEAVKTGNLDFLEGCWQGTRPEYYSKRTIRECFCFGPHGGNGKRRVIDPQGGRKCIGASSAHLGSNGVLSVRSEGAACTDGERWGQAEMVCRGKGQRTPCSWVFKDANGGRQAYEIPFVRVESCGRR